MTVRALMMPPAHIRSLRRVRRSAWVAILMSFAFRLADASVEPGLPALSFKSLNSE